jgi:hypothetical protein
MIEPGHDAGPVVDVDRRHLERTRALPQADDRHGEIGQISEQAVTSGEATTTSCAGFGRCGAGSSLAAVRGHLCDHRAAHQ